MAWTEFIPQNEIKVKITSATVEFAEEFGKYLGRDEKSINPKTNRETVSLGKLTTSQLRKFFGEVKRQQMNGYNETDFILLKPKLAYAVGRDTKKTKIVDFYNVISNAIDLVGSEDDFERFIKVFESIVAYHKAAEVNKNF